MSKNKLSLSTILESPILSRIIVGIGEVSDITSVSARQLRYWESKGIISSTGDGSSTNRKYDYANIEKIVLIKDFLDQGFTLEAAARRLEERIQRLNKTIIKLSDRCEADLANEEQIRSSSTINKEDYMFIGYATHCRTKEKLKIYSPLDGNHEKLLAEPLD